MSDTQQDDRIVEVTSRKKNTEQFQYQWTDENIRDAEADKKKITFSINTWDIVENILPNIQKT